MDLRYWAGWLEKNEYHKFQEAFNNRTEIQIDLWYQYHEYEDVLTHTEQLLRKQLIETKLYNTTPTEEQLDDVNQVIADAGAQLAYLYAESWYNFLKSEGVLTPKEYEVTVVYQVPHTVQVEADHKEEALDTAMDEINIDGGWYHSHEIKEIICTRRNVS